MAYAATLGRRKRRGGNWPGRFLWGAIGIAAAGLAAAPVAYMLWPAPAVVSPDAPSLPVSVGGVSFNVPPAAIRHKVQRKSGPQARIDMSFVWPSLAPPDLRLKPGPTDTPGVTDRLFLSIAASDGTLSPLERLKEIYPRYLDAAAVVGADGLSVQAFRDGSAYQSEDLIQDPAQPEKFLLRCTRNSGLTPPMCLHERRIGGADLTVRFPREWLSDWQSVSAGIERLIASFKPLVQ